MNKLTPEDLLGIHDLSTVVEAGSKVRVAEINDFKIPWETTMRTRAKNLVHATLKGLTAEQALEVLEKAKEYVLQEAKI